MSAISFEATEATCQGNEAISFCYLLIKKKNNFLKQQCIFSDVTWLYPIVDT